MWLKNMSIRAGLAGLTALTMVISTGGIAQAYEDSSLNAAMTKILGKLRGAKYGDVTERALTKLLEVGKERFFDVLGIGGCYGVYINW